MAARSSIQLSLPMLTYSHFSLYLFVDCMLATSHSSTEGLSHWQRQRGEVSIGTWKRCGFGVQPSRRCEFRGVLMRQMSNVMAFLRERCSNSGSVL